MIKNNSIFQCVRVHSQEREGGMEVVELQQRRDCMHRQSESESEDRSVCLRERHVVAHYDRQ